MFDPGPVVSGPVHEVDLPAREEMLDVALKAPLAFFALGRHRQGDDSRYAEVLGDALDRGPLTRGIPPLENHHDGCTGVGNSLLHDDELGLKAAQLGPVDALLDPLHAQFVFRHDLILRTGAFSVVGYTGCPRL